jgi:diguanylate cyclase (GGDEF)-like protein
MIDLDHFKKVNDEFGHNVGDVVLKCASKVIQENVRDSDVVARYGGEEFVVCMPNISLELARSVAERIRSTFAEVCFEKLTPTLSAGVAVMKIGEDIDACMQDLLKKSDDNLYRAKESGRNRVV